MSANWWGISAQFVAWTGVIVILLALLVPWIAQRIKRRRRCPKCWYDLSHSPPPATTCSECGYTAKRERRLYKARRRWKLAFLGAFMLIGAYALNVTPAVKDRGWPAAAPTTVLIVAIPWLEPPPYNLSVSPRTRSAAGFRQQLCSDLIEHRVLGSHLAEWQRRMLIKWSIRTTAWRGELDIKPDAAGWIILQAVWSRDDHLRISQEELALLFDRIMDDLVDMRDEWPQNVPLRVSFKPSLFLMIAESTEVRATPRYQGALTAERRFIGPFVIYRPSPDWIEFSHDVGIPPSDIAIITLDITIETRIQLGSSLPGLEVWRGAVAKPFRIVDHVGEIILPESDETIRSQLRRSLDVFDARYISSILVSFPDALRPRDKVAVGLTIEIVRGEHIVMRGTMWASREPNATFRRFLTLEGDAAAVANADPGDPEWRIIVRGDPLVALRDLEATSYWAGEFEAPLTLRR